MMLQSRCAANLIVALLAFGAGANVSAQDALQKVTAIRAGKLVDVVFGKTLADQTIVIKGEHIAALGPSATMTIPAGAEIIDLSRSTVLPGLIDAHTHLTADAMLHGYRHLGVTNVRAALYGARAARLTLEAGFTSVRNVGAQGFGDVALRDAINDGDVPGPRMLVSAYALGTKGGHCDETLLAADFKYTGEGVADGPWAARAKAREMVKYGADLIKICATGGVLSKGDQPAPSNTRSRK
jgi:imidazolonepropionase-like amidohydrolase